MEQKGLDFGSGIIRAPARRRVLRVFELTEAIQGLLETEFFDVWVEGEISNLKFATSGHWYFSLKDDHSQVRAVVWKTATRLIRFRPQDGMKVVVRGSVRVYAPRGEYQLQVEVIEPLGKGSLQQAYEELKERLAKEGLFAAEKKRPLPMLPRRLGIVSSPTGAVIQDILRVLRGRYRSASVLLYPARVQGPEACGEIVGGIRALNRLAVDVIILARGGGSLEDLWPFNDEGVARAIATSKIPTISAVGHETDVTIADFVADARAPTPSAAALQIVKAKDDVSERLGGLDRRLDTALPLRLERIRARVRAVTSHRVFEAERGRIRSKAQRTDELIGRAEMLLRRRSETRRTALLQVRSRLDRFSLERQIALRRQAADTAARRLLQGALAGMKHRQGALGRVAGKLESLSPLAVLSRGYALVWNEDGTRVLRRADDTRSGETVRIRLHEGTLRAVVRDKESQ